MSGGEREGNVKEERSKKGGYEGSRAAHGCN